MTHLRMTAAIIAATTILAGCSSSPDQGSAESAASPFGHVHGIGLNPGDGLLYVASHHGVFRLDHGSPTLVADRAQDTMGFTIAAPDQFLASGHPAIGSDDPNPLGLIESTDRAATWSPLSLAGTADLHSIDTAGDVIYVFGSAGEISASDDGGTSWSTVLRGQFLDIAADPTEPDRLLATTDRGALVSITRGEEATAVKDAPLLVLIDRTPDGTIVGVDPTGSVAVSDDDGQTWQKRATLSASPQALSVRSDTWFAATEGGLLQSSDAGATWDQIELKAPQGPS